MNGKRGGAVAVLIMMAVTGYCVYPYLFPSMGDKTASEIYDGSKLKDANSSALDGPVFFGYLKKFMYTLDDNVIGDSCTEGIYGGEEPGTKEEHLKKGIEKARRTLFENKEVEEDLNDILGDDGAEIMVGIKFDEMKNSEGSEKEIPKICDLENAVSRTFIRLLLKEKLSLSGFKGYLDKLRDDFNEHTKNHRERIGVKEGVYILGAEGDSPVDLYDYIRIVMFATSKLIPLEVQIAN